MRGKIIIFLLIIIIVMTLNNITQEKSQICINNECINVELAVSSAEKTKGLMFRESLDGGMLFVEDPKNLINVEGVLPDLEGIYIITNITEKIVPTGFQTILEGKLLKKRNSSQA